MDRLCELVRLHRQRRPVREIARLLKISPNTERKYRHILRKEGLLVGDPDDLPSLERLRQLLPAQRRPEQEYSSIEKWRPQLEELLAKGLGPTAIHAALSQFDDFDGSLSSVKRFSLAVAAARGPRPEDVDIPVVTAAGEVAQVDFGDVGELLDPATGKSRKAYVFVMVLCYSRHMFAKVVFDQRVETWLQLHVEAFDFFGGVPRDVVPDNLKAAVIRHAFDPDDLPVFNRAYRELARHYGFVIDPTPPRSPKKKGKVERSVRYVKSSFFGPRSFRDIQDANQQLETWVLETAGMRTHGTTGWQPLVEFQVAEKATLRALPAKPFRTVSWKRATVGTNSHVTFDRSFWSVPWTHMEQIAYVRATTDQVEILVDDVVVAVHARQPRQRWHTQETHLPEGRRDLRHRSREFWEARADAIGDEVGAFIRGVFDTDEVQRPLRRVASMLRTLEDVSPERAKAACLRAAYFGCHRADELARILRKGLDREPLPGTAMTPGWVTEPRYARSAQSFLASLDEGGCHGRC